MHVAERTIRTPDPGIYEDIPFADYLTWNAASQTGLRKIDDDCPAVFHAWEQNGDEDKEHFRQGTAVDTYLLEPELFFEGFAQCPTDENGAKVKRTSKAGKEKWAQFKADNPGKILITPEDYALCKLLRKKALAHSRVGPLLRDSKRQVSMVWEDRRTGVICKGRLDMLVETDALPKELPNRKALCDVKALKAGDGNPKGFDRVIANWGYQVQAAFYHDGYYALTGQSIPFIWIVGEKTDLGLISVHRAKPRAIAAGQQIYGRALYVYRDCVANDRWPGYDERIHDVDVPDWLAAQQDVLEKEMMA